MRSLPAPGSLTPRRLRTIAKAGETAAIEFKGRRASAADIVDAVVCMVNGDGGLILWGVDDDGAVSGMTLRHPESLRKTIFHSTSPSQVVDTQVVEVGDVRVLAVWADHSPLLVSTTSGAYLQRVGTECVPMTPDRLVVRQIDTRALDVTAATTPVGLESVDEIEVRRFRSLLGGDESGERLERLPTPQLLRAIGASRSYGSSEALTLAGLLVFGQEAEIRETLPQHQVVYLRTPAGSTDYERRVISSAPILRLLEQLTLEVSAGSRVRTLRLGPRDLELPDYPERVLREAIVNALAHRHYTLPGDTVIRQTAAYLEIENPGGFPEGIGPETVIQHAPVHRNRQLCEILDKVRLMERSGLGVDRIYEDQLRYGKLAPAYEADRTSVRLRLDAREFDEPLARYILAQERDGRVWRVEELLVISHLRRMGPTDRGTLARVMQRPESEAQDVLSDLIPDVLGRFGSGPGTRYALAAQVQAALGSEAAFTRERGLAKEVQRNLIMQHAEQFGRVDNQTVRDLLEVSRREATLLLGSLADRGALVQRSVRRWAYYEPSPQQRLPMD